MENAHEIWIIKHIFGMKNYEGKEKKGNDELNR